MGKFSKTKTPQYSGGTIYVNGRKVASSHKNGNSIDSNYYMSDTEKKTYDAVQNGIYNSLENLFDISDNQRTQWQDQLNAMRTQGIQNINDIYTPIEKNLRNNIASRFGNLDNSAFLDKLDTITDKKAKSIADLSNNLSLAQNNLYTQELNNRINTISFLQNLNSSINSNMLGFTNAAGSNSSAGTSYNNSIYGVQNSSSNNPFLSSFDFSTAASIAAMII